MMRWDFWRRERRETDLEDEIAYDLALDAEERIRSGVTRQEAERGSRRDFGNVLLIKEGIREMWGCTSLDRLGQDLRYGWRAFRKNPLFATMAVLSLALGIGANTAIFSFMDAILMRARPVWRPGDLVILNWHTKGPPGVVHGMSGSWYNDPHTGWSSGDYPFPAFELLRAKNSVLSSMFGFADAGRLNLSVQGQTDLVDGQLVSGNFFSSLGVRPAAGRLISDFDDRSGATPAVVISYNYWRLRFAGSTDAVGQSIFINRMPFMIAGVSAPEFFGVNPAGAPDLFIPLHAAPLFSEDPQDDEKTRFLDNNFYWVEIMGRLRPGTTLRRAQSDLAARFQRYVNSTASTEEEKVDLPALVLADGGSGIDSLRREYAKPLYVLMAMVGLILAIACANIANLLLARAAARQREIAVRLSLGAGRFRVVRQLLTESVMLASLGGALGVLFATWGVRSLTFLLSNGQEDFTLHAELNWNVLGVTAALSVVCGLLFGLAPAIQSTRPDVMPALKNGRGDGPRRRAQHVLVVAQIAMSFLILVAAGLFVRTLNKLHSVQLGYARENILLFSLNARQAGHRDPEIATFYADLRKRFESIPGVSSATLSQSSIISADLAGRTYRGTMKIGAVTIEGARVLVAGPRFLTTMQIPILAGREIDDRDQPSSTPVAVISERLARTYFGNENPVGRRITFLDEKRDLEIVGVSANLRYGGLKGEEKSAMTVFVAVSQFSPDRMTYALRTAGDPLRYVKSEIGRASCRERV